MGLGTLARFSCSQAWHATGQGPFSLISDWPTIEFSGNVLDWFNVYQLIAGFGFTLVIQWSGVGAGVIVVPVLTGIFATPALVAVATGSAFSFATKLLISIGQLRGPFIQWGHAFRFLKWSGFFGVLSSLAILGIGQDTNSSLEPTILVAVSLACLLSLLSMVVPAVKSKMASLPNPVLSCTTGVLVGMTGVGGGVLVVPALINGLRLTVKEAVATSIPIGLVLSALTALVLGQGGYFDEDLMLNLCLGAALAMPVGITLFKVISPTFIRALVTVLILTATLGSVYRLFTYT